MAKIRKFSAFILAVVILTGFSQHSLAQSNYYEEDPHTFYGGLIAGGNFSQVDGDNFAGYHKVGMNVGGIVYASLADHLAASLEILYSQKGSRAHKTQLSNNKIYNILKYDINLNYAEVPVMLNYFDRRKSNFGAGFSYSQLISFKENVTTDPPFNTAVNLDDYPFKKMDVNFIVGGNLHLYAGFFLNFRFQYSLFAIRKNIYPEFGRAEQYNNMYTLRLMYLF